MDKMRLRDALLDFFFPCGECLSCGSMAKVRNAKELKLLFVQDALKKKRGVRSQVGLNAQQRIENMQGAVLPGKHAGAVEGKSVLLIDDVLTTGSTAEACAKALREAGAKELYLLTAARRDPHAHLSAPIED